VRSGAQQACKTVPMGVNRVLYFRRMSTASARMALVPPKFSPRFRMLANGAQVRAPQAKNRNQLRCLSVDSVRPRCLPMNVGRSAGERRPRGRPADIRAIGTNDHPALPVRPRMMGPAAPTLPVRFEQAGAWFDKWRHSPDQRSQVLRFVPLLSNISPSRGEWAMI
jgi:hypothetical protein